ncbi:Ig-like domain-containing protein [Pseudomonas sp. GD03842]|uniref:Ig-like domain-containing protein n=1 Tax=Pseudomonas sp. GD03842 TaxID=2975385 RepID=UPI00244D207B|nr:Ig-like domain-containing protein [Pseudomonas sp. GD03842]MDH0745397.1 Ig-like domain-containing protein [Pseudomonas sp. GD03842]
MNTIDNSVSRDPIPLELPVIPVALENGLVHIEHLLTPIVVNFPVWPAAQAKYTYQLMFDGQRVPPEKEILASDKPGDLLAVHIPVDMLTQGTHTVSYRVYSPNTLVEDYSGSIPLIVDLSAPGSPELAPISFPTVIQEGLTSDELEAINNLLPGRIASYSGMAEGDVIRTYWGTLEGPLVTVTPNDMGLNRVMVDFSRAFLAQADGKRSEVYYTVTDLAGNVSMHSEPISVELQLSVVTPLPTPTVKEAQNGILDPANTTAGATVVIDATARLREGEKVVVRWNGPKGSDSKERLISAAQAGQPVSLVFASALVSVNDGQTVEVAYSVTRRSGVVQDAEPVTVKVLSATLDLPAPTVDTVGPDGVLRPSLITGPDAIARASYRGMLPTDRVKVRWDGTSTFIGEAQTVGDSTHLRFGIPKAYIEAAEGGTATVSYLVERNGQETQSHRLELAVREGMKLDTTPVALAGKVYLIPGRPDVLPTFPAGTTVTRIPTAGQPPYNYASSNPGVAVVDGNGLTSVRDNGSATITVTDAAGESKSYDVTVSGVINCVGVGSGSLAQMSAAAAQANCRIPSVHELIEIFNAYGNRWPMGMGNYWSSTVAKNVFGAKWYYVKNLNTGKDFMLLHHNASLGVAIR